MNPPPPRTPAPAAPEDDPPPAEAGTTRSIIEGRPRPRLPHEHDQSADSQAGTTSQPDEKGRRAQQDLERGLVDTDRGPLLDRLYQRLFRRGPPRRRG
jgi:hypothetical protein